MTTRREFLEFTVATVVTAGIRQPTLNAETTSSSVPYRTLGRTGEKVSVIGVGGYHVGKPNLETQESILQSKTVSAVECLHYAMNLPTSVVITGCDSVPILQQALDAARSFRPLNQEQVATMLAKTSRAAQGGNFELYKTSHHFDGTYQNPQWLG